MANRRDGDVGSRLPRSRRAAFIEVDKDGIGEFRCGTVAGDLDARFGIERDGESAMEFSWEAESDSDPACGRGWALLDGDTLRGHLFIHRGDDSDFVALRAVTPAPSPRRALP